MAFSDDEKMKIIKALRKKGVNLSCPRCGNNNFNLIDGFQAISIQSSMKNIIIGGKDVIPTILLVCTHCGFISSHALGAFERIDKHFRRKHD